MKSDFAIKRHRQLWSCILTSWLSLTASAAAAPPLTQIDLDTHQALWESHNITDYDFILSRSCFCQPEFIRPGLVSVRSGAIVSVIDIQTGEPHISHDFYPIDSFFDSLRSALDKYPFNVSAEFDSVLGYPRFVRFDDPLLFDEDIDYGISGFRIVPESRGVTLGLIAVATLSTMRPTCRPAARDLRGANIRASTGHLAIVELDRGVVSASRRMLR